MRRTSFPAILLLAAFAAFAALAQPLKRCAWGDRSESLVSPDGSRAVHVRTAGSENPDDETCCIVEERLVREHAPDARSLAYRGAAGTWLMKLVDWSPDGKSLLIEQQELVCYSDFAESRIVLWDDAAAKATVFDAAAIVERHPPRGDCYVEVLPVGFLSDGRVVVSSRQEATIDSERCTKEMTDEARWWAWSPASAAIAPLARSAAIKRYGSLRLPPE